MPRNVPCSCLPIMGVGVVSCARCDATNAALCCACALRSASPLMRALANGLVSCSMQVVHLPDDVPVPGRSPVPPARHSRRGAVQTVPLLSLGRGGIVISPSARACSPAPLSRFPPCWLNYRPFVACAAAWGLLRVAVPLPPHLADQASGTAALPATNSPLAPDSLALSSSLSSAWMLTSW